MSEPPCATRTTRTTCCYCGVGCGVTTESNSCGDIIALAGDPEHPANFGRLCVKGSSLHETQDMSDRLLTPMLHGSVCSWDAALAYTASEFQRIIAAHGPDAVAFYLSGQLLTEDYYVANKLMKGFIGTANVDTNSRLCMAAAVVAHKRAFGEDLVPGCYEDLEACDLLVLVGSNMAFTHPVVYQRVEAAKQRRGMQVVVIDPRRTPTCELAEQHLALRPGSDAFLFNGLLAHLAECNALATNFLQNHCDGLDAALAAARASCPSIAATAAACDLPEAEVARFFARFATTDKTVTVFSQGINQSSSGVDKCNAIINCHLATGRIGKLGASPFSITGQPNAMGGREVGGLANQLAAHMNFGDELAWQRVADFWQAPNLARREGLKAVDMFEAIHAGNIKAVWIMATNPVVSMPNADRVREALAHCELVVVSECVATTDSAKLAHVLLPTTTWGEKIGTVTNSERCMSLQKGFLPAPGQARHDWQILTDFAHRMGYGEAFAYGSARDVFVEHAALSGVDNNGSRAFDIAALAHLSEAEYLNFQPVQWPVDAITGAGRRRLFDDGRFFTANGRAKLLAITPRLPQKAIGAGEVLLNTGRVRDQWHTMSRTGSAAKLVAHTEEPYVEIHPATARALGIGEADIVCLENDQASYLGRARLAETMRQGEVFAPIHWNDRFAKAARVSALAYPVTDPHCGQPEFKQVPVRARACAYAWQGFLLSLAEFTPTSAYWCKIPLARGAKFRLADHARPHHWQSWLSEHCPGVTDWLEMTDSAGEFYQAAGFSAGRFVVYFATHGAAHPKTFESAWLEQRLGEQAQARARMGLLAGRAAAAVDDPGAIICSCFQVGDVAIRQAIADGTRSAAALGERLRCGTNCGSCVPELNALIASHTSAAS